MSANTPMVSVLVPCFNTEKYLSQCLDSIINSKFEDIEIICINDGSTDTTLNILKQYASRDPRINILNKKNSGYGDSLNQGLDLAKGKYISIVESDDYIENLFLYKLVTLAEAFELDVCKACYFEKIGNQRNKISFDIPQIEVLEPIHYPKVFLFPACIWSAIYLKEFLNKNNIRFLPTPGASYQDVSFSFKVLYDCKRFMYLDDALVNYRIDNPNSSSNDRKKIFCVNREYEEIFKYVDPQKVDNLFRDALYRKFMADYRWNFFRMSQKYHKDFIKRWVIDIQNFLNLMGECSLDRKQRVERFMLFNIGNLYYPLASCLAFCKKIYRRIPSF